jgi:GNAT superfamily N-acetyltransferase
MRASEFTNTKLVIFDIDDTLVNTDTKVGVVRDGRVVKRLNSHDFTHYKLQPGESFDFGAFRDAQEFFQNARPIAPMISQLKRDIATGNKVIMVTARAEFDDRDVFLNTFRKYGVEIDKVHVYLAGNIELKVPTEEKKKMIIRDVMGKDHYDKVIMYDDAEPNLHAFMSLASEYPWSKFYAWHVDPKGNATEYHRSGIKESAESKSQVAEGIEDQFEYKLDLDRQTLYVNDQHGLPAGRIEFSNPNEKNPNTINIDMIIVQPKYQRQKLGTAMYRYLKKQGYEILQPTELTPDGEKFFGKINQRGVTEDTVDEMALQTYKTMGDFSKPGPFTGADKKLVPHPKNIEKATQFFEQTPFDFRLFFSHLKGTGKYSEHGPMSPDQIKQVFGQDSEEIINGSEDAITVVYVGNKGDAKVMLTPWMMAHRFGHAINAGVRNKNWTAWGEAEKYFFQTVNSFLEEHYGKVPATKPAGRNILYQLEPEYNALFNAMGTQRSSKSGQIRRPYEFLYELFAQYLGTGKVTLNPLPTNLTYGKQVFGNPTKYMNIKPEYRDEAERKQEADSLAYTMELLFNDVLSDSVGKIFVM